MNARSFEFLLVLQRRQRELARIPEFRDPYHGEWNGQPSRREVEHANRSGLMDRSDIR